MTFANLSLEVLQEFADVARAEPHYGLRFVDVDQHEASRAAWLKANGWYRQTPTFRARAVETTRQWRAEQLRKPETAAAYRAKHAAQARRWLAVRKARGGA